MAYTFVVLFVTVVCINAGLIGAPVAHYSPAVSTIYIHQAAAPIVAKTIAAPVATYDVPVAVHAPAVGTTSQSVFRSLGGAVSHYSKAEDSAFSTDRKYDTRITNDASSYAHAAPIATYAHANPVVAKS